MQEQKINLADVYSSAATYMSMTRSWPVNAMGVQMGRGIALTKHFGNTGGLVEYSFDFHYTTKGQAAKAGDLHTVTFYIDSVGVCKRIRVQQNCEDRVHLAYNRAVINDLLLSIVQQHLDRESRILGLYNTNKRILLL